MHRRREIAKATWNKLNTTRSARLIIKIRKQEKYINRSSLSLMEAVAVRNFKDSL